LAVTATMTGRVVDAPLERLYKELRRLRRKAGDVSYGYIARKNTRGLSKTTVAAILARNSYSSGEPPLS
jgi:hypothetical protein